MKGKHAFRRTAVSCIVASLYPVAPIVLAQANSESCAQLLVMVEDAGDNLAPEFLDVREVALRDDPNECTLYTSRIVEVGGLASDVDSATQTIEIERQATIQGEVQVTLPDPEVTIEQSAADVNIRSSAPEVTIDQGQPTILVRQATPIITVRMAQPTITVEQPAPEIVITMPEPGVSVATAQPLVEVTIPEPRVTVVQGEPMLNVDLDTSIGDAVDRDPDLERLDDGGVMTVSKRGMSSDELEPRVVYIASEGEPTVSIQGAEPSVEYVAADPDVRVESEGDPIIELVSGGEPKILVQGALSDSDVAAVSLVSDIDPGEQRDPIDAFAADPSDTAYDGTPSSVVTVDELDGMEVINGRGELLGEVNRVVKNGADTYLIVEHGGWFFDIGDKQVAFPIGNIMVRDDNVVLRGMTEEQIEAMPDYDYGNEIALDGVEQVELMRVVD